MNGDCGSWCLVTSSSIDSIGTGDKVESVFVQLASVNSYLMLTFPHCMLEALDRRQGDITGPIAQLQLLASQIRHGLA